MRPGFCAYDTPDCATALAQALRMLGYGKVYHGWNAVQEYQDNIIWRKAYRAQYEGGPPMGAQDWDDLLGDCEAVTDQYAAGRS